ncbi:Wzz/FepE/Etk N-terminal domain-containing protein [uncultured Rhodoblastus sp.]|uniref:Wzz/FepE/Etk N-terminal domain-containing protein n=1 Tax=uncultured Rhodoblastus sp. TaxID=543037 RepID=UPI0025DF8165|nr:Wzz/FepE/Etk N-terminal domain-containing protein [uncultured Rhodoblastus sp.]
MGTKQLEFRAEEGPDEVDLDGVLAALRRNSARIAAVTLAATAAALLFCLMVKPRYLAESRILVENQESYFTRADPDGSRLADAPALLDAEEINSQIQLLTSRDLARKAIAVLGLKGDAEFDAAAEQDNFLKRVLSALGAGASDRALEDRLLTRFFDHLTVMSPAKTRVLQVEFTSRDPDLAARAANVVADLYIELKGEAKRDSAIQAARNLKPLIAALEARAAQADARVEEYRAENGLFDNGQNATVPAQQLGEIAAKLAEARAAQSEAEARARSLRDLLREGRLADAGDISSNDLVRRIAEQRVVARSQLASESRTLLPAHPRIKELKAQLAELDKQLRLAVDKAARGLDNDARVAGGRVDNLAALLEDQKRAVAVSSASETRLRELQREDKILKDQLASEAAKYQAALARADSGSAPPDARIISRALAPSQPVFPKKGPIVIFAALAGLAFSVGFLAAREMTRQRREEAPLAPPAPRETVGAPAAAPEADLPAPPEPAPVLQRLKQAVSDFSTPALALEGAEAVLDAPEPQAEGQAAMPDGQKISAPVLAELTAALPSEPPVAQAAPATREARKCSPVLTERIARAAISGGVKVLIVCAEDSAPARPSLKIARALAREGRAMLTQVDEEDVFLHAALEQADGAGIAGESQPGLAQLLKGEASFAQAIYRDAASRLHIVQAGGPVETEDGDLGLVLDALAATYDFVLIAGGRGLAATSLAAEADLTVIFAGDARMREYLRDDFTEAGAREVILAALDSGGEAVEIAA